MGENVHTAGDSLKRADQIALLNVCAHFTDTGEWKSIFTYPNCGWNLVQLGLVTDDKKITTAGRFALWVLGHGEDPMPDEKSFVSVPIPPSQNQPSLATGGSNG